jgi:hypothetical protein
MLFLLSVAARGLAPGHTLCVCPPAVPRIPDHGVFAGAKPIRDLALVRGRVRGLSRFIARMEKSVIRFIARVEKPNNMVL